MNRQAIAAYLALLAGILIGGCATGVYFVREIHSTNAIRAEIESLRSNPSKFAGRLVRISGRLDECFAWECSLCPETMTTASADPKQCLPLEFHALMPGTGFGEEEQEGLFRFSSVTLTAKFDPTCFRQPCLDRPVVLYDADVSSVQSRRRSSGEGLWLEAVTPLQDAAQSVAAAVRLEALKAGIPSTMPTKVFTVKGDAATALACWTPGATSASSWPNSLEGALYAKSTLDFYNCNKFRMVGSRWIAQVQGV